jgi:hypothetical protein
MSIKTKAVKYAIRLARKRTGLKVKKLKSNTLLQYITKAGQKRKLTETQRAAHKLRTRYEFKKKLPKTQIIINRIKAKKQHYESLKKTGPRITAKSELRYKSKQKPKTGGGVEPVTTAGTRYGVGSIEHKVHRPGIALASKRWGKHWPHERESWRGQMDRMYGGVHMSLDPKRIKKSIKLLTKKLKKKKVIKALRGALIKKGTKLAYRLATQKYPQVFKKKRFSVAEYKAKKIRKTPELASLGVTKIAANDLRKLAVAEAIKSRITHLGNLAIKHNKKAVSLFWGKAKHIEAIVKLEKYHKPATKKKLESLGKQYANLTKYQDTIKAKTATKHSEGGEVVIGKNVDQDLL